MGGRKRNGTVNGKLIADVMENYQQMPIKPKPGSLVIFDDSRILHRVSTVEGNRRRITVGGFVAFSENGEKVYYWS
jgi:Rps23 Pro-64 3,4-dihydroxylase Tpa1-like proline 4-hydroxylase